MTSNRAFRLASVVAALCIAAASAAYPNGSGAGTTTCYWDCCKPTCAWSGNVGNANGGAVRSCSASSSGNATIDSNTQSGCGDGSAYVCTDQQPFVRNGKAYAFAAANVNNVATKDMCCACYELTFTNTAIRNKVLTVQVVNTGSDLRSNQFDLQVPGGGMGLFTSGCPKEFPGSPSANWGARYGGVSTREACSGLPSALVAGCQFRFDWFEGASIPNINFNRVACPAELTNISGCKRADDDDGPAVSSAHLTVKAQATSKKPAQNSHKHASKHASKHAKKAVHKHTRKTVHKHSNSHKKPVKNHRH